MEGLFLWANNIRLCYFLAQSYSNHLIRSEDLPYSIWWYVRLEKWIKGEKEGLVMLEQLWGVQLERMGLSLFLNHAICLSLILKLMLFLFLSIRTSFFGCRSDIAEQSGEVVSRSVAGSMISRCSRCLILLFILIFIYHHITQLFYACLSIGTILDMLMLIWIGIWFLGRCQLQLVLQTGVKLLKLLHWVCLSRSCFCSFPIAIFAHHSEALFWSVFIWCVVVSRF